VGILGRQVARDRAVVAEQGCPIIVPMDRHGDRIGDQGAKKRVRLCFHRAAYLSCARAHVLNVPSSALIAGARQKLAFLCFESVVGYGLS
jgi:hypothetical protein